MRTFLNLKDHPNIWGSLASGLCLLHCAATPFLFVAHTSYTNSHNSHPFWWSFIDIFFVIVSFWAIYWSTKNSSKQWMKYALWSSWILLLGFILNEKAHINRNC